MNCVILQPSYIPWRGYFDQIHKADTFVFYDDVQYDKRGWRNRNIIKTLAGPKWLTIPVLARGSQLKHTPINSIRICWDRDWCSTHSASIEHSYRRAPHFDRVARVLASAYAKRPEMLADFTINLTMALAGEIGITSTRFVRSSELGVTGTKTDRLLNVLEAVGASHYVSGPSARSYLEEERLNAAGITVEYMQYDYPEYPQLYPPFDPAVSIVDLLCMTGPAAAEYIWGAAREH